MSTAQFDSAPATLPSKSRGVRAQVLTRPKEKSLGARICEALRVMNPFESTAGRNTCRSMASVGQLARPAGRAAWPEPARASTQKVESARSLRGKAGLMKSPETRFSRRALGPLAPGRTATVGVSITARKCSVKVDVPLPSPSPARGRGLGEGLARISSGGDPLFDPPPPAPVARSRSHRPPGQRGRIRGNCRRWRLFAAAAQDRGHRRSTFGDAGAAGRLPAARGRAGQGQAAASPGGAGRPGGAAGGGGAGQEDAGGGGRPGHPPAGPGPGPGGPEDVRGPAAPALRPAGDGRGRAGRAAAEAGPGGAPVAGRAASSTPAGWRWSRCWRPPAAGEPRWPCPVAATPWQVPSPREAAAAAAGVHRRAAAPGGLPRPPGGAAAAGAGRARRSAGRTSRRRARCCWRPIRWAWTATCLLG